MHQIYHLRNNSSNSIGTPRAEKTSLTEATNSGPTPSPGTKVHLIVLSVLSLLDLKT